MAEDKQLYMMKHGVRPHSHEGRMITPGMTVLLTATQGLAFRDKFELVKQPKSNRPAPPAAPEPAPPAAAASDTTTDDDADDDDADGDESALDRVMNSDDEDEDDEEEDDSDDEEEEDEDKPTRKTKAPAKRKTTGRKR